MENLTFIELLKVVVIGIIQGITEWLPISSTGHMILAEELLQLNVSDEFMEMFRVVIQFGSILAVVVLYFRKLNPFALSKSKAEKRDTWTLWFKVLVGIIPAGVVGVLLDDWLDEHLYNYVTVAAALIVYGILFIIIEKRNKNRSLPTKTLSELTYKKSLAIGAFQMLSLIPGTSRSGSTIIGASILGCERPVARRILVLHGDSGHARREPSEARQIRLRLHIDRAYRNGGRRRHRVCRVCRGDQVPDGLYPQARLLCVRLVPDSTRYHSPYLVRRPDIRRVIRR